MLIVYLAIRIIDVLHFSLSGPDNLITDTDHPLHPRESNISGKITRHNIAFPCEINFKIVMLTCLVTKMLPNDYVIISNNDTYLLIYLFSSEDRGCSDIGVRRSITSYRSEVG